MARRVGIHTGCEFFRIKGGQSVRGGLPVVGGASLKRHALPRTRRAPPKPLRTPQIDAFTIGLVRPTVGFLKVQCPAKALLPQQPQRHPGTPALLDALVPQRRDHPIHGRCVRHSILIVVDSPGKMKAIHPHLPHAFGDPKRAAGRNQTPSVGVPSDHGTGLPLAQGGQHDVDDPANSLAAKSGTCRTVDHLDLLHHAHWNAIERIGGRQTSEQRNTVDEDQGVGAFHAIHVDVVGPANAAPHRFTHPVGEIEGLHHVLGVHQLKRRT